MPESSEFDEPPPLGESAPPTASQPADHRAEIRPNYLLAASLFLLTFFSTTTLGAGWYLSTRTNLTTSLLPWLVPQTIVAVWTDPVLLSYGLKFSIPVLFILICHELGHYCACRFYNLPATLPYFIPAPIALGTLGAFIRIKAPIRRKVELFDVGAAGPLTGFVVLIPFLVYGMWRSKPGAIEIAQGTEEIVAQLFVPGTNLALQALIRLFHGHLEAGTVIDFHPFALAGWVGMLATALNLLPMGQLDGGHILYAVAGRLQRWIGPLSWIGLALAGLLWSGWWFWCVIILVIGLRHPPIADPEAPLGSRRRWAAAATLLIFILVFIPIPLSIVFLAD